MLNQFGPMPPKMMVKAARQFRRTHSELLLVSVEKADSLSTPVSVSRAREVEIRSTRPEMKRNQQEEPIERTDPRQAG